MVGKPSKPIPAAPSSRSYTPPVAKSKMSEIASPDAPITTNEHGGSQSLIPARFDLIDGRAMLAMAEVLHAGAEKYGEGNWKKISVDEHLNHLLMHIFAYLSGDQSDDHLSHILCRATFAQAVDIQGGPLNETN